MSMFAGYAYAHDRDTPPAYEPQVAVAGSPPADDEETNRLISSLLAQDLEAALSWGVAEQIQLELALADSDPSASAPAAFAAAEPVEDDRSLALRLALDGVNSDLSTAASVKLNQAALMQAADMAAARQLNAQLVAQGAKERLDHAFARALQGVDNDGQEDVDQVAARGVERVLGVERVRRYMVGLGLICCVWCPLIRICPVDSSGAS